MSRFSDPDPKRVVVAQLAFIGDMVFTTPLLAALRARWPAAQQWVVGRPAALEVLEDHPGAPQLIAYDKDRRDRGAAGVGKAAAAVRAAAPDLFLAVSRSARTALLARLSGAPRRIGFGGAHQRWAYTVTVDRADHETTFPDRPLRLLEPLGQPLASRPLELAVREERRVVAAARLHAAGWNRGVLLAIAPGAHYATKRWPAHHLARLLDLVAEQTDWTVALYGGPAEEALIDRLLAHRPHLLDRRGIGIRGVMEELTQATLFLAGDSGPAHIARALGVRTIILHGPTDPKPLTDGRPYPGIQLGIACQPCSPHGDAVCPLGHHRCLEDMSAEFVLKALQQRARAVPT